jgi:copper chaperone CopZ
MSVMPDLTRTMVWIVVAALLFACGDAGKNEPAETAPPAKSQPAAKTPPAKPAASPVRPPAAERVRVTLAIEGMHCEGCAQTIQKSLRLCPGVAKAEVSFEKGRAVVTGDGMEVAALERAVTEGGYKVARVDGPVDVGSADPGNPPPEPGEKKE